MEYWNFSEKELDLIADLMLQVLLSKPDKSELSTMELFREAMRVEHVEGKDKDGYPVHGLRILDFKLKIGKYLHQMIKWDFQDAVWNPNYEQGIKLDRLIKMKATQAGYIVDGSWNHGLFLGPPYGIPNVYRLKNNLISSFEDVAKTKIAAEGQNRYYVRKQYETVHRHYEHKRYPRITDYDQTREMQLWRIPAGQSTGMVPNKGGRVTCYVLTGECSFECSHWVYGFFVDGNNDEAMWKEYKEIEQLSKDQLGFARCNDTREETEAPQTAWYKLTNTGNTDLYLYVVDAAVTEYVEYAPLIGISRLRMGSDGKGIRTLIAFHDCELDCKYCINPSCKLLNVGKKITYMSAKEIAETIKKDELYYLATNGGITLGGGEPLLHCNFLKDHFFKVYGKKWHVTVETSLNVTPWMLFDMSPYIDEYVVDIKDMNPAIYKRYTGNDNEVVKSNLQWLIDQGKSTNILVRLPLIPGYNTEEDRRKSKQELESMGITRFNLVTYKTNLKDLRYDGKRKM